MQFLSLVIHEKMLKYRIKWKVEWSEDALLRRIYNRGKSRKYFILDDNKTLRLAQDDLWLYLCLYLCLGILFVIAISTWNWIATSSNYPRLLQRRASVIRYPPLIYLISILYPLSWLASLIFAAPLPMAIDFWSSLTWTIAFLPLISALLILAGLRQSAINCRSSSL